MANARTVGAHIAMIAASYDLDVCGGLRDVLPPESTPHDSDGRSDHP